MVSFPLTDISTKQCTNVQFNSIPYFTQTIIYMVDEVIKQYNIYRSIKTNQKLIKLMGEEFN